MSRRVKGLVVGVVASLTLVTTGCSSNAAKSGPSPTPSATRSYAPYYPTPDDPIKGTNADLSGARFVMKQSGQGAIDLKFAFASAGLKKIVWGYACSGPGMLTLDQTLGVPHGGPKKCMYSTVTSF
jgi:hypothetical protein